MPFKNKEDAQKYHSRYNKMYFKTSKGKFYQYKRDAKRRGFIFQITFEEFDKITKEPCYYCGGQGYGIDRVDSSIGYVEGNMVPCCTMCNHMKRTYPENEFIEQCIKIVNNKIPLNIKEKTYEFQNYNS